ncbi:spore germination protein (amino acid permease) [Orenia metallireducens]|uniref:Spore germination protein (Amino acid permease) n=1 Tax=Orenia metallireducens TaxID=1413210 RepID=A0A285GS56_9FIRM|nr:endospore germination permease [Orenia metallireducens]PRX32617.1 spore germination protein (amino acid permease) [Orenia metallireducens]SNY26490.1 spore germination protein (amino acid permease) [Orenia metallireducens]
MIKESDGKIGIREFVSIIVFSIILKVADMTPNLLFKEGMTATWMMPLIMGGYILLPLLILLSLLNRYKSKGLIELIYSITGKYVGFIISFVLTIISLLGTAVNLRDQVDILNTLFFPKTPIIVLLIIITISCYLIAKRGLEALGRTCWLLLPIIIASFILLVALALGEVNLEYIYPIWGPGLSQLFKSSLLHISIFGELFLMTTFYPFVRDDKKYYRGTFYSLFIIITGMVLSFLLYITVFDYPTIQKVAFPFQSLSLYVSIGYFIANVENLFLLFWFIGAIMRFSIYLYVTAAIFAYTIKIEEFELLLFPISLVIISLALIPENSIVAMRIFREDYILKFTWSIFIFLPVFLWVVDRLKGRADDEIY